MKNKLMISSVLTMLIFILSTGAFAQDKDDMKMDMKDMKHKPEMSEMLKSQHHQVMMAYKANLLNLSKTLESVSKGSDKIDVEFAKAIFTDIERSGEMMKKVHQDHMSKTDAEMSKKMAPMMEKMKKHEDELRHHIMALGKEINAPSINSAEVEKHATAIVGLLENKKMDEKDKGKMHHDMKDM